MYKFLRLFLFVFYFIVWEISYAEETQLLDDITPDPTTFESGYIDEPEVTITKEGESTIEEFRINGQLYMVKVTPDGASPYYLYKETLGGAWERFDSVSENLIVPQWVILEF
tara:strand:+ start:295 stop:630 length:336 start_codon:yes stop_codon:yes gene_type:complete